MFVAERCSTTDRRPFKNSGRKLGPGERVEPLPGCCLGGAVADTRSALERGVAVVRAGWPDGIHPRDVERVVAVVLEAAGWKPPPPPHQRVGGIIRDLLKQRPMTYAALQKATGLSVGAVANGLKACGAVVVRKDRLIPNGKGGGKPTYTYGLP
jgi:hypothetical protein